MSEEKLRYELIEGEHWLGGFGTRGQAQAHAELVAAKRGERVRWQKGQTDETLGHSGSADGATMFTVRRRRENAHGG